MKQILLALGLAALSVAAPAQPRLFSMEDAMIKSKTSLAPDNLRQLQFVKGTNDYVYVTNVTGTDVLMRGNYKTKTAIPWLSVSGLNALLRGQWLDTVKSMPALQWMAPRQSYFLQKNKFIVLNHTNAAQPAIQARDINGTAGLLEYSPTFTHFAFLKDNNLYVSDFARNTQLTTDGSADIVYGQSVHRDEFGISKGTFWSPGGKWLAFYRMDQSMVSGYPIVDWTARPATNNNVRYPMAGDRSHEVTVGVYHVATGKTVYLNTGLPADQYLTNIAWSPDEQFVYVAVLNRGQNQVRLNRYDATTGNLVKTLFEEKDDKYVEPQHPMLFVKNNPGQFVWQSRRSGYNHLYLYSADGALIKQLTNGDWEVTGVKGFDAKGQKLFFTANAESPLTSNLYSVALATGKMERLTQGDGVHLPQVSDDGSTLLDVASSTDIPRTILITETKKYAPQNLLTASNPLAGYATVPIELFPIKGPSGSDLYCRLYKPYGMEAGKKYPVIVYWYGGPHVQTISNNFLGGASDLWFQYMAQRGYVVFSMDVRGSGNRGKAFEQSIFRNIGGPQVEDLMAGVAYLKQQPFVDAGRMGLFGWSFGGFLTTRFMLNHPDVFKAAVAGGPVMDWGLYEVMYTERYMDTPQENPAGYTQNNMVKQAGNLKGKLLLIHGMQDPVVVQQHSVNFVKACVDKGVQVDYMIYPGHEHNVTGRDRAHLYQKVTDYFMAQLK
jgi:dipeptidyl-peptidase 4